MAFSVIASETTLVRGTPRPRASASKVARSSPTEAVIVILRIAFMVLRVWHLSTVALTKGEASLAPTRSAAAGSPFRDFASPYDN
jgi:hypothetical protein